MPGHESGPYPPRLLTPMYELKKSKERAFAMQGPRGGGGGSGGGEGGGGEGGL